jgi:hypothetical protein
MKEEQTEREQALRELTSFLEDLWKRVEAVPTPLRQGRQWTREELYERRGKPIGVKD